MIERMLGNPDRTAPNPKSRKAAPMKFWALERVLAAESSEDFTAIQAKAAKRSAAMTTSAAVRIEAMLRDVEAMSITMRPVPTEHIEDEAKRAWKERDARGRSERQSAGESDAAFTRRIVVNYARHQLTTYDRALEETAERVGATAARERIRQRIYGVIAEAYPHLRKECERQMRHRGVTAPGTQKQKSKPLKMTEPTTRIGKYASRLLDF